ncbi:hypothetical protein G4D82_07795 [Flavobacterium sp. CYK-4]|uniref:DUF6048 family protein n=1 Tax=Flavobacterium lotistagni TaxID=2709660 RepID=UPI001408CECC|nr:DUF6048 family protein [Flavobacterium lotistagni]NHM07120.1 hypothetical protein [Flavobacterium lotistagni]
MKRTSKFLCSLLVLVLSSFSIEAQTTKTDTIAGKTNRYGLRVGVDLFKLTRGFYEDDYKGLEIVGDYRLTKKYYLAGEIGNEDKTVDDDQLNFTSKGTYFRAGIDYNLYENWLDMENMVYIGARYGVSSFSQTLNSYTIYNRYPYFGASQEIVSGEKFSGLSAQWIEVLMGVKAKVINNFYVGFSLRVNKLLSNKKPDNFDNLYIPGFNRTYDGTFGAGFNYTVSYFIPIYKKKVPVAAKK